MSKPEQIRILGIETSADETSAAILLGNRRTKKFKLLSNIIYSQILLHQKTGGIVPEVAARAHIPKILPAIKLALAPLFFPPLNKGGIEGGLNSIDAIAVTAGPGLVTSLRIGVDTAKALAYGLGIPIIPVNHMEGHLLSSLFPSPDEGRVAAGREGLKFPALGLTVSGGHTMLVLVKDFGKYKILGQTVDDAAGECFDKVAKLLSLPYPGGPAIGKLAEKGKPIIDFPRPMLNQENYNFSFAGLKTAVLYFLQDHPLTPTLSPSKGRGRKGEGEFKADIAASVQQAIIDVLVAKTVRAAKEFKVKTILLGGGVSANQKLRNSLRLAIKKFLPTSDFRLPTSDLCTDNAGMIAVAAFYHVIYNDVTTYDKVKANPNWELKSWR